mmetsp:Transcript_52904/g.154150  ORF Transcript_52904/g.154150 Transcript_52904/m.154150 type:complete len:227 (+) Transcript_52904:557-1237(+)
MIFVMRSAIALILTHDLLVSKTSLCNTTKLSIAIIIADATLVLPHVELMLSIVSQGWISIWHGTRHTRWNTSSRRGTRCGSVIGRISRSRNRWLGTINSLLRETSGNIGLSPLWLAGLRDNTAGQNWSGRCHSNKSGACCVVVIHARHAVLIVSLLRETSSRKYRWNRMSRCRLCRQGSGDRFVFVLLGSIEGCILHLVFQFMNHDSTFWHWRHTAKRQAGRWPCR